MAKQTKVSKSVLWQSISDQQAEVVKGGGQVSVDEWCNRTGKLVKRYFWVP
ncbi:hypothetical protein [Leptothoe kymatousa]|uniref:Uncharacterized protein n=1 Tax=Leptothoe kymatousa TAU-MAC 1615 TaxID=2364775 RepID=A0ABS5Y4P2_9CYAN|nr:hypothetical protein [Leptothoe kymatousa]MBT9312803.1 hypothetical protein [Leptothoe kymatousa TAU-MAC 1615]